MNGAAEVFEGVRSNPNVEAHMRMSLTPSIVRSTLLGLAAAAMVFAVLARA